MHHFLRVQFSLRAGSEAAKKQIKTAVYLMPIQNGFVSHRSLFFLHIFCLSQNSTQSEVPIVLTSHFEEAR